MGSLVHSRMNSALAMFCVHFCSCSRFVRGLTCSFYQSNSLCQQVPSQSRATNHLLGETTTAASRASVPIRPTSKHSIEKQAQTAILCASHFITTEAHTYFSQCFPILGGIAAAFGKLIHPARSGLHAMAERTLSASTQMCNRPRLQAGKGRLRLAISFGPGIGSCT